MRNTVRLHLTGTLPSDAATWQLVEPGMVAPRVHRGTLGQALDAIQALPQPPRVEAYIPGQRALHTQVNLPMRQRAKLLQAIPYALEEQLADDVDDLHFAVGQRQADGSVPVIAIARDAMRDAIELFEDRDIEVEGLYVDTACVLGPLDDAGDALRVVVDGSRLIVTQPGVPPVVLDTSMAELISEQAAAHDGDVVVITVGDSTPPMGLPEPARQVSDLLVLLGETPHTEQINLRQGDFAPAGQYDGWWRPWQAVAALAGVLFVLGVVWQVLDRNQLRSELIALQDANVAEFQALFPSEQRIVDIGAQLDQQLRRLRGDQADTGLLYLLDQTRQAFGADPKFQITEFQFRDGDLYLSLEGESTQAWEALQQRFEAQDGVAAEVQSANAAAQGLKVRLKLTARSVTNA